MGFATLQIDSTPGSGRAPAGRAWAVELGDEPKHPKRAAFGASKAGGVLRKQRRGEPGLHTDFFPGPEPGNPSRTSI